jgi:hypothetical protein
MAFDVKQRARELREQDEEDRKQRARSLRNTIAAIREVTSNADGYDRLRAITDEEWAAAEEASQAGAGEPDTN